jgi:hypothetical protein
LREGQTLRALEPEPQPLQNRADFDSYEKSDYARHLRDVVGPLLGSPYDDRLYALLD